MSNALIQVDMFEVQLGASMLLQFQVAENKTVRILADAGIRPKNGYLLDHVHHKLRNAFQEFDGRGEEGIDLMIGTHYDADHLDGFVPIIEDRTISIGEAWLPPVANDSGRPVSDTSAGPDKMLAKQFELSDGGMILKAYLAVKDQACLALRKMERDGPKTLPGWDRLKIGEDKELPPLPMVDQTKGRLSEADLRGYRDHFKMHLDEVAKLIGEGDEHEDVVTEPPEPDSWFKNLIKQAIRAHGPTVARHRMESLARIRRATAKEAINATSLYEVVKTLQTRDVPICCHVIPDGTPAFFAWEESGQRFICQSQATPDGLQVTLLGPSQGLVERHWKRLPIGDYNSLFAYVNRKIEPIRPSNQLSYVLRIGFENQGLLVTGDAGFVDFKMGKHGQFHPALLKELLPLHVVQVAHHGGNNAYFYDVLKSAEYTSQAEPSFLLLSHATHDRKRPSKSFRDFMVGICRRQGAARLLFTSEPDKEKVRSYCKAIHKRVGNKGDRGDVRLVYRKDRWSALKHAIQI